MYEIYCKLRDRRGLKDADVVRETGITKSTFSDWKSGRSNPKNDKLQKIADYFDVSLDYLTGNSYIEEMGHIIQEERIDQGISQEELAIKSGVPIEDLELYEAADEPIREDLFDDIVFVLGTSHLELLDKYGLYDEPIPAFFNGDVISYEKFKKARDKDAWSERDDPEDVLLISRAARKMTPENRRKLIEMAKIMFAEDFDG